MDTQTVVTTWSAQQTAIFRWFERAEDHMVGASQHCVVTARAGTGKTTVIIEGVKRAPDAKILVCAFSKIIQEEMGKRLGQHYDPATRRTISDFPHIEAKTLHSVGYACIRLFRERIKVVFDNGRADKLAWTVCGNKAPDSIVKLVSKLHTKGREIAPHATKLGDLTAIAIEFECQPEEAWSNAGFDADYVEKKALEAMELASNIQNGDTIDGSDMIFLPVRNGWLIPMYDLVVVDEAQDMTIAQLEIAEGVLKPGGRIAVVGDNKQAIFAFRGADKDSLERLKAKLAARELKLTTTYRCGRNIVARAQRFVPDFEAGPDNPDGLVYDSHVSQMLKDAGPGDFILSRINAPLAGTAMALLRAGKRTRVAGRDIGKGLKDLIYKFKAHSVPDLLAKIETWVNRETLRLTSQMNKAAVDRKATIQRKIEEVRDKADTLIALTEGAKSVAEIATNIEGLFTDDGKGAENVITCSSVHRAKGLEAKRVFILAETLRETTEEEKNISYVAITRAKETLVMVYNDPPKEEEFHEREYDWRDDRSNERTEVEDWRV